MHGLILAAGGGTRLRPFTEHMPKCLVPVHGKPIIVNALEALEAAGCTRVTIVVGHKAEVLQAHLGVRFQSMDIAYITNDRWAETNSMFSLHLGLEGGHADFVLEGDVFFDHVFLQAPPMGEISWMVDSRYRESDGSYLRVDDQGRVVEQKIVKDQTTLSEHWAKSVGILLLTPKGSQDLADWLRTAVAENKQELYYDLIMAEHLDNSSVGSVDIAPQRWFEIDTPQDLAAAERLFR